jgi:hypothetical protein
MVVAGNVHGFYAVFFLVGACLFVCAGITRQHQQIQRKRDGFHAHGLKVRDKAMQWYCKKEINGSHRL